MAKKNQEREDLHFETAFCEGIVKRRPEFVPALIMLGDLYTRQGLCEQGLEIDKKLCQLLPDDPVVFYNLACSHSLLNGIDQALAAMKTAIDCGYNDFQYMSQDTDLRNLFKDRRFADYLSQLKAKRAIANETQPSDSKA